MSEQFQINDVVEHLKTHEMGRVYGVAKDIVKVVFGGVRPTFVTQPTPVVRNCKPEELRKL